MDDATLEALDLAIAGDPRAAGALLADRAPGSLALRAALARNDPALAMPSQGELERRASDHDDAAIAAALAARDALASLDAPSLARAARASAAHAARAASARAHLESRSALAWSAFAAAAPDAFDLARALEPEASRARLPHLVVDAAALAACAALHAGDLEGATALARRASRMARTEGLPQEEYLAHTVLARVRRHAGRPHLATRIAAALARAAPPAFRAWLALEMALSGAREVARRTLAGARPGPGAELPAGVLDALAAATRGDRGSFDRALASARDVAPAPFASELDRVARALDPEADAGDGELGAFLRGESDRMPGWIVGLAQLAPTSEPHASVRVLARPGPEPRARRVLAAGLPLARAAIELGRESGARQHRRESALAVLALAGPDGLPKEELFRAVWGYAFVPRLHQGALDVLLHRLRAALDPAEARGAEPAELVRRDARIALVPRAPVAVPDPRTEQPLDDRVLACVSARGGISRARELAEDLGVPLRTVQAALGRLVEEGECLREGEGQALVYRVEDTTFREPTRLGPRTAQRV